MTLSALKTKLIIDTDPCIGDALAITTALLDPNLDVLALTATAGMVSGKHANHNLHAITGLVDAQKWPRVGWCHEHLPQAVIEDDVFPIKTLYGTGGLGDFRANIAPPHAPTEAAKLMADLVRQHPKKVHILCLGPLTNLALAAERSPDFFEGVAGITCMGGTLDGAGNVTPVSEFNMFADPEAARSVFDSKASTVLVPLDVSQGVTFSFADFDRLPEAKESPISQVAQDWIQYALRTHRQALGQESISLNEIAALATLARPKAFERELRAMRVETEGTICRGATIFDQRHQRIWPLNCEVVTSVDAKIVTDYFLGTLWSAII